MEGSVYFCTQILSASIKFIRERPGPQTNKSYEYDGNEQLLLLVA